MNSPQTQLTRIAQVHRNLESLATMAAPATALWDVACSSCQPIKKAATTGNTHISFNIRAQFYYDLWLSLLPVKNRWQQNYRIGNGWRPLNTGLLPLLPLLPLFLESQQHVYACNSDMVTQ